LTRSYKEVKYLNLHEERTKRMGVLMSLAPASILPRRVTV